MPWDILPSSNSFYPIVFATSGQKKSSGELKSLYTAECHWIHPNTRLLCGLHSWQAMVYKLSIRKKSEYKNKHRSERENKHTSTSEHKNKHRWGGESLWAQGLQHLIIIQHLCGIRTHLQQFRVLQTNPVDQALVLISSLVPANTTCILILTSLFYSLPFICHSLGGIPHMSVNTPPVRMGCVYLDDQSKAFCASLHHSVLN